MNVDFGILNDLINRLRITELTIGLLCKTFQLASARLQGTKLYR